MVAREYYANSLTKSGVNVESAYGTAASTFEWVGLIQSNGIKEVNVTEKSRSQNNSREITQIDVIQKTYRGPINRKVQNGKMLLASFGDVVTTGASSPYTHTFSTGNTLPSLSIYKAISGRGALSGIDEIYTGCVVSKLSLEVSEKGFLMATEDIMSNGKATTTSKTVTGLTATPYRFADIANGEIDVNSGTKIKIISYKYSRDNKLTDEQEGESIAQPSPQEVEETLSTTVRMHGTDLKSLMENKTEFPLVIEFARGANDTLTITHNVVITEGADPETGIEGAIETEIQYDVKSTTIVVVDSTAAYTY